MYRNSLRRYEQMGVYLNPGSERFRTGLRSQIYVDKTGLIKQVNRWIRTEQKFICVSRPRRFGKSMAVNMLTAYYACGEDTSALFANLKIASAESYREHLNQYDVIKINMQEFLSATRSVEEMLKSLQKRLLKDLKYVYPDFVDEDSLIWSMKDINAEGAIAQIKQKNYVEALQDYKGNLLLVGINYDGDKNHSCVIEKWTCS